MMPHNDRLADILGDLPSILGVEVLRFLDYAATKPSTLFGYLDVLALLPHVLAERRYIQGRRCIPPFHIHRWLNAYPCRRKLREKLPGVLGWRKSDVRG